MLPRRLSLALAFLVFAPSTTAQVLILPESITGLTPIEGHVVEVQSMRVPLGDAVMGSRTQVTLHFVLQGCLDSLMPLISHYEVQEEQVNLYVTALNAHNQESTVANCVAMPQATAQVNIPGVFDQEKIQVTFLGNFPSTAQETYTNERFGFRFAYPENLALDTDKTTGELLSLSLWTEDVYEKIQGGVYEGGTEYPPSITVSVHNPQGQSLLDWANSYQPGVQNVQLVSVSGQAGIRYLADGLYPSENVAFLDSKGRVILLNVGYLERETSSLLAPFEDIVRSFQFIR
jgi:hypothetical protein